MIHASRVFNTIIEASNFNKRKIKPGLRDTRLMNKIQIKSDRLTPAAD